MTAEDQIKAAFQDLEDRAERLDATRNRAPNGGLGDNRNRAKARRGPILALAAAAFVVVGGGAVAVGLLTNDTQVIETGPTESTQADVAAEVDGTETSDPPEAETTDQTPADASSDTDPAPGSDDGGQTVTLDRTGGFTSPSGNIACVMWTFAASCWIGEKEWEIEQPTHDSFCAVSDWGNAIDVGPDGVIWPCYSDFGWPIDAEPLAYGDRMRVGEFECASAEIGVTCMNGSGEGFRVSRAEAVIFPDDGLAGERSADPRPGDRFAVTSGPVAADIADPFLNVRVAASPSADVVAKLPPSYTGLVATGRTEMLADGSEWMEVRLIDPVEILGGPDPSGGYPVGWVKAAFTVPLVFGVSVTAEDLPPCSGEQTTTAAGTLSGGYVYGLEHGPLTNTCHRVVISFGGGNPPVFGDVSGDAGRSSAVPSVSVDGLGQEDTGITIDLGQMGDAWFAASDNRSGVYLARGEDDNLDVVTAFPVDDVTITTLADQGRLVIDLESVGVLAPSGNGVSLLAEPKIEPGSVTIAGLARPFESMLSVSIEDGSGQQVQAFFSGGEPFGEAFATSYGLSTTDWTVAWGLFDVTIEVLDPGDYTIVLNASMSNDLEDMFRYDVTIP